MGGGSDSLHTHLTRRCSDAHELVEMADLGSRLLITLNHSLPSGAIVLGAIIFFADRQFKRKGVSVRGSSAGCVSKSCT